MTDRKHAGEYVWSISLDVECPHCFELFDANETDDFSEQLRGLQVCQEAADREVVCPKCGEEFLFDIAGGT